MAKLTSLKTDAHKQENGAWVDYKPGVSFLIARSGNQKMVETLRQLKKPYLKEIRENEDFDPEILGDIGRKAAAQHILLGWSGIEGDDDQPWEYTPERSLEIMTEASWQDVAEWVLVQADRAQNYAMSEFEAGSKN